MAKVLLPIENNPSIRAYMGDATLFAIIESEMDERDCVLSDVAVKQHLDEWEHPSLTFDTHNISVELKNGNYIFVSKQHIQNKWANVQWKNYINVLEFAFSFSVVFNKRLDMIKQMTLFLSSKYYLEFYSNGLVMFFEKHNIINRKYVVNRAEDKIGICIAYKCNQLEIFYKTSENQFVLFDTVSCNQDDLNLLMQITPALHPFYNILYNNYLQLIMDCTEDSIDTFNYCNGVNIFKVFDNVLKIFEIDQQRIQLKGSYVNFIKSMLSSRLYVWLQLDEYYIPGRSTYQMKHFVHPNLAYGFDEENQTVEILGYNFTLSSITVSFDDIEKACCSDVIPYEYYNDIVLFRKNEKCYPEPLNIKFIIKTLEEYKYGYDTDFLYGNMEGYRQYNHPVFGLNIYKTILGNDILFSNFVLDRRWAYILAEHKNIMLYRIMYLCDNEILTEQACKGIKASYTTLHTLATTMCNLVVKNQICSKERNLTKIHQLLEEMLEIETVALDQLLVLLKGLNV